MGAPSDHTKLTEAIARELFGDRGAPVKRTPELLALAEWHRVGPVLAEGEPSLASRARRSLFDSRRSRALARLRERGIPVMVMGGAALVETTYAPGVSRDLDDIDLLVRAEHHEAAVEAVTSLGVLRPDKTVQIRVHDHVVQGADRERFDLDGLWERAWPSLHGEHLLPSPEDLLIGVCLDFLARRDARADGALAEVRDIAWLAARAQIDWDAMRRIALRSGVSRRVQLALTVTRRLGLLPIEEAVRYVDLDTSKVSKFIVSRVLTVAPALALDPQAARSSWLEERRGEFWLAMDELGLGRWLRSLA